MKSYSVEIPRSIELISEETYIVRWGLQKEKIGDSEQYSYNECIVPAPLTSNNILQVAIRDSVSQSDELKLINDYNASQLGIDKSGSSALKYKNFIEWRDNLKQIIDELCAVNNIQ